MLDCIREPEGDLVSRELSGKSDRSEFEGCLQQLPNAWIVQKRGIRTPQEVRFLHLWLIVLSQEGHQDVALSGRSGF